ncbi:MAG: hypothetical protein GX569_16965 [Candidatus Riflebacteria bacterium]|nr:hypothetical protein [Candidatus Riflebacteria bacterium]
MKGSTLLMLAFLAFCSALSLSGESSSKEGNLALMPMYGGVEKTESQLALDAKFVSEVTAAVGTREKGSAEFNKMGWKAFLVERNPDTAMMRFNQAWLLNPDNHDVLWGFGVVSGAMGNTADSVKFLRQASEKLGDNAMLLTDLGFSLTIFAGEPANADSSGKLLEEAFVCFTRAEKIKPDYEPLYSNWAAALFINKDYAGAWQKIIKAEELGGKTVSPALIKDLEAKMPRP